MTRSTTTRIALTIVVLAALFAVAGSASAAVILSSFEGKAAPPDAVHLAWVTDNEAGNLGFHVWRQTEPGNAVAVAFVPSTVPPVQIAGAAYTYTDTPLAPGLYTYWLVSEDTRGNLTPHDAIQVLVEGPTAVELASLEAVARPSCRRYPNGNCECYIPNIGWRMRPPLWCTLAGR